MGAATEARTEEAPPIGTISVSVNIIDSDRVSAIWSSPSQPNGFITYEVLFTGLFYISPGTVFQVSLSQILFISFIVLNFVQGTSIKTAK